MATTKVQDLTSVGNIADGDVLVGERVTGTTVNITFNGVLLDSEFSSSGLMTRTAAGTYANRTITGTTNEIDVANGDGVAGNPTFSMSATYVGQTSITTLGTITTGTWNGTAIDLANYVTGTLPVANGGTGQTTYTNGQLLIGNTTGNTLTKATLSEGEGIDITNGTGTITIAGEDATDVNKGIATFNTANFAVSSGDVTIKSGGVDLTDEVTGTLPVANGGTGATTLTDGGILLGSGTGAITSLAQGTNGQLPIGSTGVDPVMATITGGTNLTVTNGAGSITLDVDDVFISNTGDVGTGAYDFGGATSFEIPNGATPTVDAAGEIAIDTTVTDYTGMMKYHDGTEELTVIALPTANLSTTNGDVLSYNATNNEFEMGAPAAGTLDWELVSTATASSDATIDFTGLDSTYIAYQVIVTNLIPATDATAFSMRVGTGGTPTYQSGATDYALSIVYADESAASGFYQDADEAEMDICLSTGTGTGENVNAKIMVYNPSNSTVYQCVSWESAFVNSAGLSIFYNGQGVYTATTAVTALRFLMSSGNISSGEFRLYGLRAS